MTNPKTWAELCAAEGHFPKLPEVPPAEKLAANAKKTEKVFDAVKAGLSKTQQIAKATGIERQTVRRALTELVGNGRLVLENPARGKSSFVLPSPPPAPAPEKYPDTSVTYRHNAEPNRACSQKQHMNPIRLPAEPPSERLDAILQGIAAIKEDEDFTGKNGGATQ